MLSEVNKTEMKIGVRREVEQRSTALDQTSDHGRTAYGDILMLMCRSLLESEILKPRLV
jgi:hypothetical protein